MVSGLNQVYQSVARLIKLCDDLLILGEEALNREYVTETIHLVEDAVQVCIRGFEGSLLKGIVETCVRIGNIFVELGDSSG